MLSWEIGSGEIAVCVIYVGVSAFVLHAINKKEERRETQLRAIRKKVRIERGRRR